MDYIIYTYTMFQLAGFILKQANALFFVAEILYQKLGTMLKLVYSNILVGEKVS